jgi:hypothetical protein
VKKLEVPIPFLASSLSMYTVSTTMTPSSRPSNMQLFVKELNPMDVLLGRGTGPNDHQGNQIFRDLIDSRLNAYTTARSREDQIIVIMDTIAIVYARGGRFLKKIQTPRKQEAIYEIVTDMQALVYKAKQSFRYSSAKSKADSSNKTTIDPHKVLATVSMASGAHLLSPSQQKRLGGLSQLPSDAKNESSVSSTSGMVKQQAAYSPSEAFPSKLTSTTSTTKFYSHHDGKARHLGVSGL